MNTELLTKDEAIQRGATALFGEKYDADVRVVSMEDFSMELCGGTHVAATGEIGLFVILSEAGIAAGIRRIEALTGRSALEYVQASLQSQAAVTTMLNCKNDEMVGKVENVLQTIKESEKKIQQLSNQLTSSGLDELLHNKVTVAGVTLLATKVVLENSKSLRELGDKVRDNLESGVAVLGGVVGDKVALLAIVTKDLTGQVKAGAIVNEVAKIVGGKGGGRPDMAQAGGTMPDKLAEAIAAVPSIIEKLIKE